MLQFLPQFITIGFRLRKAHRTAKMTPLERPEDCVQNNGLECIMKEIRRPTRAVAVFRTATQQ